MHEHFPFSYALTESLSDDPEFVHPDTEYFMLLFRCSMRPYSSRGAEVSLYLILDSYPSYLPLFLRLLLDSSISDLASITFLISCIIMYGHLYVIAVVMIYYSLDL